MAPSQASGQTSLGVGVGASQESLHHSSSMSSPPIWPTRKSLGEMRSGGGRLPTHAQPEHMVGASARSLGEGEVAFALPISELPVTSPLCRAAEAVLQGRAESILAYHQQNVPRAKLDQVSVVACLALRYFGMSRHSSYSLPLSSCRPLKCHPPQNHYP